MRIGLLHPRTGVAGIWAPSMDAAALVGAAEINAAGGILGEPVELVPADSGFSIAEAVRAVDMLIDIEGVDAVVGGHPSNVRDAVSERISSKVPYVYTPQYEGIACGPSTIAIGSADHELMRPSFDWLRHERRAERFFFVGNDYIWPRMALGTTRQLLKAQGSNLVGQAFLPLEMPDYRALMSEIARSGAQVVVQALVGMSCVHFNRAFAEAGLDQKILRFGLIVDETVICNIGPEASFNLYTAASFFADHHSRYNDHFLELYHDAFGAFAPPVSAGSIGCYEGLHFLARLASDLQTRNSLSLAAHLQRPPPRLAARHYLSERMSGGQWRPWVHIGRADGVRLEVVASLPH